MDTRVRPWCVLSARRCWRLLKSPKLRQGISLCQSSAVSNADKIQLKVKLSSWLWIRESRVKHQSKWAEHVSALFWCFFRYIKTMKGWCFEMLESIIKNYDELPLFLNAKNLSILHKIKIAKCWKPLWHIAFSWQMWSNMWSSPILSKKIADDFEAVQIHQSPKKPVK